MAAIEEAVAAVKISKDDVQTRSALAESAGRAGLIMQPGSRTTQSGRVRGGNETRRGMGHANAGERQGTDWGVPNFSQGSCHKSPVPTSTATGNHRGRHGRDISTPCSGPVFFGI
jgi:hypothetical protein